MLSFSNDVDLARYGVQAYEALWQLSQKLGVSPGCASAQSVDDIVEIEPLRQASVFGILAAVFEALYAGLDGQTVLVEKKALPVAV